MDTKNKMERVTFLLGRGFCISFDLLDQVDNNGISKEDFKNDIEVLRSILSSISADLKVVRL